MAVRYSRFDGPDYTQMQPVRAASFSSDVMSASGRSAGAAYTVPHASPPPAYVAQMEASKILTREMDRKVVVSQPALTLLNEFLDHVLYNIILTSQSVALYQLRAALPSVLKPRLGKLALKAGEEELREYMDEDQVQEELYSNRYSVVARSGFDAELVWKLARLRCMVYTRMGDVEEEDEDEWLDRERLLDQVAASPSDARQAMAVSPNAAIFLAAILEHLGEQALYYAAQYAQKRHDNAQTQASIQSDPAAQLAVRDADIILDGKDMNHVGRDSPLSRLWRSWRRNTRSPTEPTSRAMSPDGYMYPTFDDHGRATSNSYYPPIIEENGHTGKRSQPSTPSQIPLPESDNDIAEIEGLENSNGEQSLRRPTSMPSIPGGFPVDDAEAWTSSLERRLRRPSYVRIRSSSVPAYKRPFEMNLPHDRDDFSLPIQGTSQEADSQLVEASANGEPSLMTEEEPEPQLEPTTQPVRQNGRPKAVRTPTPEELNSTVGVLAGALGAVGVHHVGRKALEIKANEPYFNNYIPPDEPLTSSSIKGPDDFDMMYRPDTTPPALQEADSVPIRKKPDSIITSSRKAPYHEIRQQQYEEHRRYSQQSHTMDTPSIYTHMEHSPRFPRDMRRNSTPAEEAERASEIIATSYAPTPEPDHQPPAPGFASNNMYADSPISVTSSKFSRNQRSAVSPEPVPEVPRINKYSEHDEGAFGRERGHSKSSSSSSKLLGFTRDPEGRPYTIHQQKAAGNMSDEVRRAHSSTPTGANMPRPGTADSQQSPKRQHLRIREDSENNVTRANVNNERPKRSLEDMIKSDETLHYTLTPATATLQGQTVPSSPNRTQTQNLADFLRNTSPTDQENAIPKNISRSRKVSLDAGRAAQVVSGQRERKAVPASQSISQIQGAAKPKNPIGEPRHAKLDSMDGVRDLADYVRSTGPSNNDQLPKPIAVRATPNSPVKQRARSIPMTSSPSPKATRKSSSRLQARDPRPSRHAESTALIDFIREGPPRQPGEHRIDRHVAPFRTTMDSDDLNGLVSQLPRDSKNSSDFTGVSSIATTNNSNAPLATHGAKMGTSSAQTRTVIDPDPEDGMPKKTRRRIKDPYAISDSDDELVPGTEERKQTNEESLIDFLRNTAPPSNMVAQPVLSSEQQAQKALATNRTALNRTPSIDRIRDLVRGGRTTPGPAAANAQSLPSAQSRARAESPHLTQIGSKLDSYRPTQVTHAAHMDRNRKVNNQSRADSRLSTRNDGGYGGTADLAEYLRNTGPPPASQAEVQPFVLTNSPIVNGAKKEEGGLKKFFSMRGKK